MTIAWLLLLMLFLCVVAATSVAGEGGTNRLLLQHQ
jgi:hypothetical protein